MKGLSVICLGGTLCLTSLLGFATSPNTSIDKQWICTTNASSSEVNADKDADAKMSKSSGSASGSFKFAMKHCRDCTKITCEFQNK